MSNTVCAFVDLVGLYPLEMLLAGASKTENFEHVQSD
jgi:hypothetical protein